MSVGLFIDGAYLYQVLMRRKIDFVKLRNLIEYELQDKIDEGYFFDAENENIPNDKFHRALSFPPPTGPGLRVKTYWLQRRKMYWPDGKPVIHPVDGYQYETTTEKAVDVGLVYHLTRASAQRHFTKLALVAGDGDFHEPVQSLVENDNIELYLIGSMNSISSKLRPYARRVLEIDKEPFNSKILL